MKRRKGFYSISVVAKMFSVHQQTVRMYEKEGLISPKRSEGNTRLFSEEDVDRLEEIINLTTKWGVNLAGVEIILRLQKKISKLQEDMNKLFERTQGQLEEESESFRTDAKKQVERLGQLKQDNLTAVGVGKKAERSSVHDVMASPSTKKSKKPEPEIVISDDWEIDYEDDK
jgi:MerR family transcriptional regulator/heat shock protein HspR